MDWIENDLSTHGETAQIIMGLHHNPLWNTINDSLLKKGYQGRDHLLSLIRNESVDVVLAGHVHYDDVIIDNDTIYITTTTMASRCDSDGYWGYRLITVENNALVAYNYKEPKYSIPSYHLIIHEQNEDSITIENKLEQAVPVILEFIAPKGNYSVNQGTIVEIREQEEIAAIYVSTTLYPRKTTTIMLS
jgi:3',5'-cyclic AMP phosphodiesterase CpdA